MDDVGPEVGEGGGDPAVRQPQCEGAVAGQTSGADPDHGHAAVVVRTGARRDQEALVPGLDETVEDVAHRVGDAVHLREERLADQGDSHDPDGPERG